VDLGELTQHVGELHNGDPGLRSQRVDFFEDTDRVVVSAGLAKNGAESVERAGERGVIRWQ